MTTLVIQTLQAGQTLTQSINISGQDRKHIESIAPYLYVHNAPSGTFTLSVKNAGGTTLFSKSFTTATIKSEMNSVHNYIHAFYPVITSGALKVESGQYTINLTSSGYTQSDTSFIAWVQQHEDLNDDLDYTPIDDSRNPLALRIKVLKRGIE